MIRPSAILNGIESAWNKHERIVEMLACVNKIVKGTAMEKNNLHKIKVNLNDKMITYEILTGQELPKYVFLPTSMEIYHRLILRASQVDDVSELKLEKSNL